MSGMIFENNVVVMQPTIVIEKEKASSRNIPEPMKREIRKRCGFGCVICGSIIYDYDHMLNDWSVINEHVAADITLLCPTHHREKTNGLLTRAQVEESNRNPFSLNKNFSSPYILNYSGNIAEVVIANNVFTNHHLIEDRYSEYIAAILIDGEPIVGFRFEDEKLLLYIQIFNEYNEQVLIIDANQLIFKPDVWDIDLRGNKLIIREGIRKIILDVEFFPPNKIVIAKAKIRFNGVRLELKGDHYVLNGRKSFTFASNLVSSMVGISVGSTIRFPRGVIHEQKVKRSS